MAILLDGNSSWPPVEGDFHSIWSGTHFQRTRATLSSWDLRIVERGFSLSLRIGSPGGHQATYNLYSLPFKFPGRILHGFSIGLRSQDLWGVKQKTLKTYRSITIQDKFILAAQQVQLGREKRTSWWNWFLTLQRRHFIVPWVFISFVFRSSNLTNVYNSQGRNPFGCCLSTLANWLTSYNFSYIWTFESIVHIKKLIEVP